MLQHQWTKKLFRFEYDMEYRLGRMNTVADVLPVATLSVTQ